MGMRGIFAAVILIAAGLAMPPPAGWGRQTDQDARARGAVEELVGQSGAQAAVAFRSLDGSRELFMEADKEYPATSQWMEIPVMIELQAEVSTRHLKFENTVVVENQFRSVADGSLYQLDPKRDPDQGLYGEIGRHVSLRDLETHMMKQNSQLATDLLIQGLGIAQIDGRMADLRASGVQLRHGFQDLKAENAGARNTVTARGMAEVLWAMATNNAVSADASKEMVGLIANSRTATSGPFAANQNDSAEGAISQQAVILYGARSFALAVVVSGLQSGAARTALMAKISHAIATTN